MPWCWMFSAVFTLALAWWPQLLHWKTDWLGRLPALRFSWRSGSCCWSACLLCRRLGGSIPADVKEGVGILSCCLGAFAQLVGSLPVLR